MKKLDFKQFNVFTGISRKTMQTGDLRESFANLLYLKVAGIRSHALALKIYQSEGATEYSDEEIQLIMEVANKMCLPNIIDGLEEQINKNVEQKQIQQ